MLPVELSLVDEPVVAASSVIAPVAVVEPAVMVGELSVPVTVMVTGWVTTPPWPSSTCTVAGQRKNFAGREIIKTLVLRRERPGIRAAETGARGVVQRAQREPRFLGRVSGRPEVTPEATTPVIDTVWWSLRSTS